ncbi:MAG: thioredoxin-disulfide reductase [Desulforhopalus sp.]
MINTTRKTLIIGSGPAGYTAAIYAARANLAPLLITGKEPGGQLITTNEVENFPGYPKGTDGPTMMEDFREQAERFGTEVILDCVAEVDFNTGKGYHSVWTENGQYHNAYTIIISTGAAAKYLGLESEKRLMNKGVSACAICDGFFFRDKVVGVVGGGDTACEEAIYLANLCPTVHMFVRRDELRASKIMQERVFKTPKIQIYWNTEVQEVLGEDLVSGVRIKNNLTRAALNISLEGLFIAIGHQPRTGLFKEYLETDDQGYIITSPESSHTKVQGVFACGDVTDKVYRQAITAAGAGCKAALDAERYLTEVNRT